MSIIQEYSKCFIPMFRFYNKYIHDMSFFNFDNIYYTDDITQDVHMFCKPKEFEELSVNGTTILPNKILCDPIVLINITSNNKFDFVRSLFHELTHIYDFNLFANVILNSSYDNIYEHKLFESYRLWSEFRAFSICDSYKYKYVEYVDATMQNTYNNVMKTYQDDLAEYFLKEHKKGQDFGYTAYDLAQSLGYIYILDNYEDIDDVSQSFAFQYISLLFHTEKQHRVFDLYKLYFLSDKNQKIFDFLPEIQKIEAELFHLV